MFYLSPNGINVRSIAPVSAQATPDLVYGPPWPPTATVQPENPLLYTPTLIGTPQQTQEGVVFRVLMDSRVKLGNTVQLDLSGIKQLPRYPNQYLSVLDQTLTYVVCAVRHVGIPAATTGIPKSPEYPRTSGRFTHRHPRSQIPGREAEKNGINSHRAFNGLAHRRPSVAVEGPRRL